MRVEVLIGMIASGKSTYARKRADEGALIICHDDLTQMIHGGVYRYEQGLRDFYRRTEESIAWVALSFGRDVVIDRTHLTRESRKRWIDWADNFDSSNTFDGRGPTTDVIAVVFPMRSAAHHANIRWQRDARGRGFDDWKTVAEHHAGQAAAEPLSDDEGFDRIIRISGEAN